MKKPAILTVLVAASLGLLLSWLHEPDSSADAISLADPPTGSAEYRATVLDQPDLVAGETPPAVSPPHAAGPPPPPMFPPPNAASSSHGRSVRSVDYDTYMVFMSVGAGGESSALLAGRLYDLNDAELASLVEYSRTALQADRDYQEAGRQELCAARSTFTTLGQFGTALNAYSARNELHQAQLGRQAQAALDPVLHAKIMDKVLGTPRSLHTVVDFPTVFASRNSELDKEIARVCDTFGR